MPTKRFVDLSIAIEPDLPSDPPMMIPKIDYVTHEMGAEQMKDFYPGVKKEQLPGGLGWAVEFLTLTTHSGTHLDAPYHYHPTMDQGQRALTIDEIPLEWCFNDGVLLDFRHKADGERITVDDVQKELKRIDYDIKPLDIVLTPSGDRMDLRFAAFRSKSKQPVRGGPGRWPSCNKTRSYLKNASLHLKERDFEPFTKNAHVIKRKT